MSKRTDEIIHHIKTIRKYPRPIRRNYWKQITAETGLTWKEYREVEKM